MHPNKPLQIDQSDEKKRKKYKSGAWHENGIKSSKEQEEKMKNTKLLNSFPNEEC